LEGEPPHAGFLHTGLAPLGTPRGGGLEDGAAAHRGACGTLLRGGQRGWVAAGSRP
jgi:hypothetical protein